MHGMLRFFKPVRSAHGSAWDELQGLAVKTKREIEENCCNAPFVLILCIRLLQIPPPWNVDSARRSPAGFFLGAWHGHTLEDASLAVSLPVRITDGVHDERKVDMKVT